MKLTVPEYAPPHARGAALAVGLAPILVLLAFTLVVGGLIEVDIGFAVFAACTAWIVVEMHQYQKSIDDYDDDYVGCYLAGRSPAAPLDWSETESTPTPTRDFVASLLEADECTTLRDGQAPLHPVP